VGVPWPEFKKTGDAEKIFMEMSLIFSGILSRGMKGLCLVYYCDGWKTVIIRSVCLSAEDA
jgi:hypothetical protein